MSENNDLKRMLTEKQKQLLLKEVSQNISMLCLNEEYPLLEVMEQNGMMMCRFLSDEQWCHFSHNSDAGFVGDFFAKYCRDQFIVVSDGQLYTFISRQFRVHWYISCYRLFLDTEPFPATDAAIVPLQADDIRYVYENSKYQQFLNMEYLSKRLELGSGFCIREHQSPVAWVMTHDDGSVGMLHVLDNYRGRGYARKLVLAMSHRVYKKGRPVFAHIEPGNLASLNLFRSMGFIIRGKLTWAKVSASNS